MKFATLLKSNKLPGWEDFYIKYELLIQYLKTDYKKFRQLLLEEFDKITIFYNNIEEATDEQKKGLLLFIMQNQEEEINTLLQSNDKQKDGDFVCTISKMIDDTDRYNDSALADATDIEIGLNSEGSASFGGEESDFESVNIIKNLKQQDMENKQSPFNFNVSNDVITEDKPNNLNVKNKKSFLSLSGFTINNQFENRKKEKAFHEILQAINSVKSFRDTNLTGLSIVIRKYKHKIGADEFRSNFLKKLHRSHFCRSKKIEAMQKDVKYVYKKMFAKNDIMKAKNIFRKIGKKYKSEPESTFFIGLLMAVFGVIYYNIDFDVNKGVRDVMYSIGLMQLGFFLFGICQLLFLKYNINCDLIFNFDVISGLTPTRMMLNIAIVSNITFGLCYFCIESHPIILTRTLVFGNLLLLLVPVNFLWYKSRLYLMSVFAGTLASAFRKVYFKHFLFADVFQSYTLCINTVVCEMGVYKNVYTSSFLSMLFPIIRICQCYNRYRDTRSKFPHIFNLTKYIVVVAVVVFEILSNYCSGIQLDTMILVSRLCSTFYSLVWDYFLDWTIHRQKKCFPSYFYYIAVIYNLCARGCWLLEDYKILTNRYTRALVEIVRRFVWILLRVENEHVNNCSDNKSKLGVLFSKELFFVEDSNRRYCDGIDNEKV